MKSVLLCRVSSKEQEETGYSLPAQEKLLSNYATSKDFEIQKVFTISESASGKKIREIFNIMFSYVKKNDIKVIVIEKADRFTRNFKDSVDMYQWLDEDEERQLHSVKDSLILHKNSRSQEKLNWDIRIVFAKNYIDNLSEEVKKGQKEKIAQGWLPTKPPIGYKTIGEKGHKTHVIDEIKAPLVKEMFSLYATSNHSLKQLTELIYKEGLRNDNGNKIVKSRIHRLLTDPFYIGQNRWNNNLTDGDQETFIDDDTFNKVQQILKRKTTPKYRKHSYLFQGIFKCNECTGTITWETQKDHVYGHCNHYRDCSQKAWHKEEAVEILLAKELNKLQIKNSRIAEWIKKAIKESHQDKIAYYSSSISELQKRQEQLNKRLEKMYEDKLDEKITQAYYDAKARRYKDELNENEKMIHKHNNANTKYYELGSKVYDLSQKAYEIYLMAKNNDDKRLLINLVFSEIHLSDNKLIAAYSKPFKLLSELVELTNEFKSSKVEKDDVIVARIFEQPKKVDFTIQMDDFYLHRPVLLPSPSDNITFNLRVEKSTNKILDVFANTTYAMELKMRWEAIKKLRNIPNVLTI